MILVVVGPTCVGKTKLSIELAKIYNGEVINADSTQIYRGMDIGTAKVTKDEMQGVKHHLIDICDVDEKYTVYEYQKDARESIEEIKSRGHIPIVVGGTGLYIKSIFYNYTFTEFENVDYIENLSDEDILEIIKKKNLDIEIDTKNRRRLISKAKALLSTDEFSFDKDNLLYDDVLFIGLTAPREYLYERTDKRFDEMLVDLVDEVKGFYDKKINSKALNTAIGYKELYRFFNNQITFREAVEECKKNTRNYVKRQYTWFNNQMDIKWFDVDFEKFSNTVFEVVRYISEQSK